MPVDFKLSRKIKILLYATIAILGLMVIAARLTPLPKGLPDSIRAASPPNSEILDPKESAVSIVEKSLGANKLGVVGADLDEMRNPNGEGVFVYATKTKYGYVERQILWIVIDGEAYPLNGTTKGMITPQLKWPREANAAVWRRTGLDAFNPGPAIRIVFGIPNSN